MYKKITKKHIIVLSSTLFGMSFGAGNLIFPVHLGQLAGSEFILATIGFIISAVFFPLLGVVALGYSNSNGFFELGKRVSKKFSYYFTLISYFAVGPLFVIPRSVPVSYNSGLCSIIGDWASQQIAYVWFSILFFSICAFFVLKPSGITIWVGKIINPLFLVFFLALLFIAVISPMGDPFQITPNSTYQINAFFNGFVEGYGTMDVIACIAFGIIIINSIKNVGIKSSKEVTKNLIYLCIFAGCAMIFIYVLSIFMGASSRNIFEASSNGSIALNQISAQYFDKFGNAVLTTTVTLACLKTCIGLSTGCATSFKKMFPNGPSYNIWALIIIFISFAISNFALDSILEIMTPVLCFIYPILIVLIILVFFEKFFNKSRLVFKITIAFTSISAFVDMTMNLPAWLLERLDVFNIFNTISKIFPLSEIGFGWLFPSILGFIIAILLYTFTRKLDIKK